MPITTGILSVIICAQDTFFNKCGTTTKNVPLQHQFSICKRKSHNHNFKKYHRTFFWVLSNRENMPFKGKGTWLQFSAENCTRLQKHIGKKKKKRSVINGSFYTEQKLLRVVTR